MRGTAEVTVDGKMSVLTENQSVYLPLGCIGSPILARSNWS